MRSAISALAGFALAGSFAFAQPSDGRLKIIHETATLRVAYRTDSRPFSYVDAQGRPVGYTIELCERTTLVEFRNRREGIAALARGDLDGLASDKFVLLP